MGDLFVLYLPPTRSRAAVSVVCRLVGVVGEKSSWNMQNTMVAPGWYISVHGSGGNHLCIYTHKYLRFEQNAPNQTSPTVGLQ